MPPELDPAFDSLQGRETPAEAMKRIERTMRAIPDGRVAAQANQSRQGYNANVGVQGPLSAGVIGAGDPYTGKPQMVGGRVQAGPFSYQYTQPTFRGAQPSHQVGVGGQPFDADAYFGVTAQQGPGGRTYGVNVSGDGWGAYGGYNPTNRGVEVGGGYSANFAKGGPVDEDTYGPSNIEERRARLEERLAAERKATERYSGDELEAPQGYITPAKAVRWVQADAGPMALDAEGNALPLIKQPGVLPLYRDPTIDSVRVAMPAFADIAGNMMGAPGGIAASRVLRAGMTGERPAANVVSAMGAGGKDIEQVVADLSKVDAADAAAIREANKGRGLEYPTEEGLDRLRMNLQRAKKAEEKGIDLPGGPVNDRMVIRAPEGKPDFVIGKLTPEDWVNRAEAMMNPTEIKDAADWYKTIRGEFLKYTNGDEAKADQYMRAWLVAQQNVDVAGAMNNVLLQREQFGRGVPIEQMRAAGMPNPTEAARAVIGGSQIEGGVGQKIADFVDAAEGKNVRSWMANHPEGGSPFVVDVHTARDTGLVDDTLLNHLRRLGYNEEDIAKAKIDLQGTPSATQYENRASWGRSDLVDHLNEIKWQGKDDWTPAEAQAVGWMGMTRLTADKAEDVVSGIERNIRRISFEIAPGEGSPWASQFGEQFGALPLPEQQRITQVIAEPAMSAASKLSGIDLTNLVHGTGGWNMYQNPAAVGQALATREGSEIAANALGYLLQQTEVWSNSVKPMTKNPKSFAVDFVQEGKGGNNYLATNEGLQDFWANVQKNDPSAGSKNPLFVGYQPIMTADGRPGIRVLIDRGGAKTQNALEEAINGPLSKMLEDMPINVSVKGHEADITKARNDWKGQNNGQAYLERLEQLLGRNPAVDLDPVRGQLEEIFKRELGSSGQGKAQGGAVKGYAAGGPVSATPAQRAAGNFPKKHERVDGLPVAIENPKGSLRQRTSGVSKMAADYGYISNSKPDADGMKVDAYVGPHHDSDKVFVINQQHPHTKRFNEHKVMLGYKDRSHAVHDYVHSFSDGLGHKRIASIVEMDSKHLRDWLRKGNHNKPMHGE